MQERIMYSIPDTGKHFKLHDPLLLSSISTRTNLQITKDSLFEAQSHRYRLHPQFHVRYEFAGASLRVRSSIRLHLRVWGRRIEKDLVNNGQPQSPIWAMLMTGIWIFVRTVLWQIRSGQSDASKQGHERQTETYIE